MNRLLVSALLAAIAVLPGCASTRVMKQPQPVAAENVPAANATDGQVSVVLDRVIIRNGPGSWSRNAKWDEYRIDVTNESSAPIEIAELRVIDTFGSVVDAKSSARDLGAATRKSLRRYRNSGIKVKPGAAPAALAAGGAAATGFGVAVASVGSGPVLAGGSGSLVAAGAGVALGGIALVAVGVDGVIQNHRLNTEIAHRRLTAPAPIGAAESARGSVFFPITPTPRRLEVVYRADGLEHTVTLQLDEVLAGLHILPASAP